MELVISSLIHQSACLLVKQFTTRWTNGQQATQHFWVLVHLSTTELDSKNNKIGQRETVGPEKVKYYLLRMESPVKGEDMKQE